MDSQLGQQSGSSQQSVAMIGGTFDRLHKGHKYYIKEAFKYADKVVLFLSTDEHVRFLRKDYVAPYDYRKTALIKFLESVKKGHQYQILPIYSNQDVKNYCLQKRIDYVLSPQCKYIRMFQRLNQIRYQKLKQKYKVIKLKIITDKNGKKISSRYASHHESILHKAVHLAHHIMVLSPVLSNIKHHTLK